MIDMLRALWAYRGFVAASVRREFQLKYRSSLLGFAWTILNPLAMIVVYTVIFSRVMQARLPGLDGTFGYSIYLCAGVLTWGLFAEITTRAQNVFLENANLLKKLSFPRLALPMTVIAAACLNFLVIFGLFTAFLVITGSFPGVVYVALVPVLIIHIALAIGLGVGLGVLNVFFRDVGQFYGIVLQFWFWLTPIVYPIDALPERLRAIIHLNPLTVLTGAYQTILAGGRWPAWEPLFPVAVLAIFLCFLSLRLFRKRAGELVDEL
jgi:lipopolysaccharide transport system permease protein